jgi:hypothetical protein
LTGLHCRCGLLPLLLLLMLVVELVVLLHGDAGCLGPTLLPARLADAFGCIK